MPRKEANLLTQAIRTAAQVMPIEELELLVKEQLKEVRGPVSEVISCKLCKQPTKIVSDLLGGFHLCLCEHCNLDMVVYQGIVRTSKCNKSIGTISIRTIDPDGHDRYFGFRGSCWMFESKSRDRIAIFFEKPNPDELNDDWVCHIINTTLDGKHVGVYRLAGWDNRELYQSHIKNYVL